MIIIVIIIQTDTHSNIFDYIAVYRLDLQTSQYNIPLVFLTRMKQRVFLQKTFHLAKKVESLISIYRGSTIIQRSTV